MAVKINTPPETNSVRLRRLVDRLEAGEIKIPKFQRKFIWGRPAVLELLESILSGYPIGSLLFWRTQKNRFNVERDIEGFSLPPTPEKFPTDYVLDGQQRLTTVYGALRFDGKPEDPHLLNVAYDLREKELRHRQPTDPAWLLPLNIILNTAKFNKFQHSIEGLHDHDDLDVEAVRVQEAFQEYQVPVVTVLDRSLEEVCPIFERINSTGRKLTVYDLMVAATFSEDFDLDDEVQALKKSIGKKDFEMAGDSVLRTVSAIRGKTIKKADILALRDVPFADLKRDIVTARKALEKSIDFLSTEVGVVNSDFLPYEAQLTVLGRAFHLLKGPITPEQRALLQDWYWLSSFRERYRGASDNILDGDLKNCELFADAEKPIIPTRKLEIGDITGREFRKGTAMSNAFVSLLATCGPLSLLDGAPIDVQGSLSWENQREFHHIFPKGYLATRGDEDRARQSDIANLMILPSLPNKDISKEAPSVYMKRLRDKHGTVRFNEILATNLVPPLEDSGLLEDDFEWFLEMRTDLIVEKVNELARAKDDAEAPKIR